MIPFASAVLLAVQVAGPPAPESVLGEITAVRADALTLRTDAGAEVVLATEATTAVLRSRPGATSLGDAEPMARSEVAVGDRVLARGRRSADGTLAATRLVVMTSGDLARKREAEQAEWRRRGRSGVVTGIDAASRELTVRLRGGEDGAQAAVVVRTGGRSVVFRRYAPDSVRFADARPSSFQELAVGDQVRLLAERDADGALVAEQVVSGAFRTLRGTVRRVDAPRRELQVETQPNGEPPTAVTVTVGADARLVRLPPELLRRSSEDARSRRAGGEEIVDQLPTTPLAQIAPGEQVAVVGTRSADVSRLTAIKVVAGLPARESTAGGQGERGGPEGDGEGSDRVGLGGESPW